MADIRIKDLTTTASSSASDDFIAIDGTTNGTRKLNAFSPTFGGNATVTGTLTVVGSTLRVGNKLFGVGDGTTTYLYSQGSGGFILRNAADSADIFRITNAGVTSIVDTTASTTTSSGALVVSGGVGVGGAITLGSSLTSTAADGKISITGTGNTTGVKELQFVRADGGDTTVLGLAGSAYAGVLTGLGNNDAYLYTSSAFAFRIFVGTSNRYDFTSSQFKINPTTASTSTSSGALVVSGGVGVAGAVNAGTFYGLVDGVTAPGTESGYARIYVDSADGDLKVKFGDGTVKTIATDS